MFLRMRNKCKIINVQRNNKAFSVQKPRAFFFKQITVSDYGALLSRDLRLLSKYASKLVCLVLICDK
ncbi:hypothetical protein NP493_3g04027 [Ridgeia piscesae]|uniref:Uncharacterized protein n=1 Tax=Ridgeia piscesae TaxID=27915 RepID=A0AAD9ULL4_RIDPI|nr:hypothetical protein NP493_3g04027 [Ridgeia piscesae]